VDLENKLKKSMNRRWCLRFRTKHPDGDNFDGVVTHIKDEFIALHEERDFEFDGVVILPKKVIKGFRDSRFERCRNKILRENGSIRKIRSLRWLVSCGTLQDVMQEIMTRGIWPAVETLFHGGKKSAFFLGPIMSTSDDHFSLRCYDAAGHWEKKYKLSYDEIFKVEIDSRYCRIFNAYMRLKSRR
jgi:hypothetical protein